MLRFRSANIISKLTIKGFKLKLSFYEEFIAKIISATNTTRI